MATTNNLANRCFWYEDTADNLGGIRYEIGSDYPVTLSGFTGNGQIYIYGIGGKITVRHNVPSGSLDCAAAT